jgi:hypothetical protein
LLIDPDSGWNVDELECGTDGVLDVDERGECRFRGIVPLSCGSFASGVLGCGDDFEVLALEFLINLLPAWQIKPAASPGSPGHDEHFLAAKIGEMDQPSLSVGNRKIRRHA